jgi:hypothetical protein
VFLAVFASAVAWAWRRACRFAGAACAFAPLFLSVDQADMVLRGALRHVFVRETGLGIVVVFRKMAEAAA